MPTLVISDLHLGGQFGADVLRREPAQERLLAELEGIDQLVIAGDALELRELPQGRVLEIALPFFERLGEALSGRRIVFCPGNHDHQLARPLLERGRLDADRNPLSLEQVVAPVPFGPLAAIAERMPGCDVALAYPGLFVRPDVYVTHGHYLDVHMTVPRLEVLGIAAVRRLVGGFEEGGATPDDYERLVSPIYELSYELAQATRPDADAVGADLSARVWRQINTRGGRRRRRTAAAFALGSVAIPAVVAGLNRAGLGPFTANLSAAALRRSGLLAISEVVQRLGVEADHVIFGHTHRPGPLEGDEDWEVPGTGTRLWNSGSWVYESSLVERGAASPYWPGNCILVPDTGDPELRRLLAPIPAAQLRYS